MSSSLSLSQLKTQGRYQEATALALRQLTAEPEAAMLHFQLACLYDVQGLEQQAIPCYLAALARDLPPSAARPGWVSAAPTAPWENIRRRYGLSTTAWPSSGRPTS